MKTKHILTLYFVLLAFNSLAHEQKVHEAITANAAASALNNNSAGLVGFLNTVSSDRPLSGSLSGTNFMRIGSFNEDFADEKGDVGGKRSLNHFYDPLGATSYGKGLSDSAGFTISGVSGDKRVLVGTNSFAWASISNCVGVNFSGELILLPPLPFIGVVDLHPGKNINTSNVWSWQNARGYEWLGLTATNQLTRQENLDNMFRAVGQVLHLLQDASQPQHVRNEQF